MKHCLLPAVRSALIEKRLHWKMRFSLAEARKNQQINKMKINMAKVSIIIFS